MLVFIDMLINKVARQEKIIYLDNFQTNVCYVYRCVVVNKIGG